MNKETFRKYLQENIMILDGATGTQLQKMGMPQGVCPEQWVIEHPETIINIQRAYIDAGSNAVYTCTFGGNRCKLEEFGLGDRVVEINRRLAELSREAVASKGFVAGDLAPTGQFVQPLGELSFDEMVDIYKEQVQGLLEGGVDFFIIETMMDIQEARAALLAVKETCNLPVCVTMTFNEDGRTLIGTDPVTALITLQSLGADAVGCNCSTGPVKMLEFITAMQPYAKVPLIAKANAGLPRLVDGKTVFEMDPITFGRYVKDFVNKGVAAIGGCCGTSPEFIAQIRKNVDGLKPISPQGRAFGAITSTRKTTWIGLDRPLMVIGERINPTGKKALQEELRSGNMDLVIDMALEQQDNGADILDINVGMPGIDEKETMQKVVETLAGMVHTPLCIDSSSVEVIEAALRIYPGRALINSISAEKAKLEKVLPIAAKYGAMFILLPLGDRGVPETAEQRMEYIQYVYEKAQAYGYNKEDIVIDGLVMTISSNPEAAAETLKVIDWSTHIFGSCTVLGLSNISFGLPERERINAAFLAMAAGKGLSLAIANPSSEMLMHMKMACDVLTAKDTHCTRYIERFAKNEKYVEKIPEKEVNLTDVLQVYEGIVKGNKEGIIGLVDKALETGITPEDLADKYMIPAITHVGDLYEQQKYFLPQLIQSAETMKNAFAHIEPLLKHKSENGQYAGPCIVLATVKGDIHDIGKNIVALMMKNHGFKVHDIGKDVSADKIVDAAKQVDADIIALSALMTTTMVEMKNVVKLAKQAGIRSKIIVGGAVVNEYFAKEIGADGYAEDANQAVKLVKQLMES